MNNFVKIIGGRYRGRKLIFADSLGLRPTSNRIRETLFNWLMNDIEQSRCLDLFAGSGALGFEALSRGAAQVTLVEKNKAVVDQLKKQVALFNTPSLTVEKIDAITYLQHSGQCYDILFLDPPFHQNYLEQCLSLLSKTQLIHQDSLIYIESEEEFNLSHDWQLLKQKKASHVHYGLITLSKINSVDSP